MYSNRLNRKPTSRNPLRDKASLRTTAFPVSVGAEQTLPVNRGSEHEVHRHLRCTWRVGKKRMFFCLPAVKSDAWTNNKSAVFFSCFYEHSEEGLRMQWQLRGVPELWSSSSPPSWLCTPNRRAAVPAWTDSMKWCLLIPFTIMSLENRCVRAVICVCVTQ